MKIVLNEAEVALAQSIGQRRYENNRENKISDAKVGNQDNAFVDINGFGGELAFCKFMNLYPDLNITPGGGDDLADAVTNTRKRVDVKTSDHPKANLIARKIQNDIDVFVLVIGKIPEYEIIGFIDRDTFLLQPKQNLGHGLTHFFPAKQLRPIEELD